MSVGNDYMADGLREAHTADQIPDFHPARDLDQSDGRKRRRDIVRSDGRFGTQVSAAHSWPGERHSAYAVDSLITTPRDATSEWRELVTRSKLAPQTTTDFTEDISRIRAVVQLIRSSIAALRAYETIERPLSFTSASSGRKEGSFELLDCVAEAATTFLRNKESLSVHKKHSTSILDVGSPGACVGGQNFQVKAAESAGSEKSFMEQGTLFPEDLFNY